MRFSPARFAAMHTTRFKAVSLWFRAQLPGYMIGKLQRAVRAKRITAHFDIHIESHRWVRGS
jgi:hypothetical protein